MEERERYFRRFVKKDFLHDSACIMSTIGIHKFVSYLKLSYILIMSRLSLGRPKILKNLYLSIDLA